ncbi:MAG TPA: RNA methyltransferase [Streptosporangiaceae bacterium]|nr:RNA methyltransferase [Streptosporangiaceae bacterium]
MEITSPANPRIKHLVALRRRRVRDDAGVTLVEGYEELELALAAGIKPLEIFICQEFIDSGQLRLADRAAERGTEVVHVSPAAFRKIAYRESPDGWLAVVPAVGGGLGGPGGPGGLEVGANPLVVICQGVEKPGNLGAILRTADAAGAAAVIATDPVTDWGNPNVIRASKGTVFSVPVATGRSELVLDWLAERSIKLVAATPGAEMLLTQADFSGPVAIAVGSEKYGLPEEWLSRADVLVRIPMFGRADSLNVATAAAIVCYEAVRQRLPG